MVEVMKKVSEKYVENAKAARKKFPKALVFDLTMDGAMKKFDPEFPLGKINVPGKNYRALSIKGIWEGLKVFENKNEVDENWMFDERKIGKKRGCKSWGDVKGIKINEELFELEEGRKIFEELYRKIIEERFIKEIRGLKKEVGKRTIVLLDYKEEKDRIFNHLEIIKDILTENFEETVS